MQVYNVWSLKDFIELLCNSIAGIGPDTRVYNVWSLLEHYSCLTEPQVLGPLINQHAYKRKCSEDKLPTFRISSSFFSFLHPPPSIKF